MKRNKDSELMFDNSKLPDYNWSELYYLTYELDLTLGSFKESILFHDHLIERKKRELKSSIENDDFFQSGESDQVKAQYYSQRFEHDSRAIDDLETTLYNSGILSIFSVFEGRMKYLCEQIELKLKPKLKLTNVKSPNGNIGQFTEYLVAVLKIAPDESNKDMQNILKFKFIRNKIAHQNNRISSKDLHKVKGIENIEIVNLTSDHIIKILSSKLLYALIETIDNYFRELVKEIDEGLKKLSRVNRQRHLLSDL